MNRLCIFLCCAISVCTNGLFSASTAQALPSSSSSSSSTSSSSSSSSGSIAAPAASHKGKKQQNPNTRSAKEQATQNRNLVNFNLLPEMLKLLTQTQQSVTETQGVLKEMQGVAQEMKGVLQGTKAMIEDPQKVNTVLAKATDRYFMQFTFTAIGLMCIGAALTILVLRSQNPAISNLALAPAQPARKASDLFKSIFMTKSSGCFLGGALALLLGLYTFKAPAAQAQAV